MKAVSPAILVMVSFLTLLTGAGVVHADRDIVYAAQYYLPPGSRGTSHSHLYRINPDGTGRTQLTFGSDEESDPRWSPDGRYITFAQETLAGKTRLCFIGASGGNVKILKVVGNAGGSDDDEDICNWSPDGKQVAVAHQASGKDTFSAVYLIDIPTGKIRRRLSGASGFLWSPDGNHAYLESATGDKLLDMQAGAAYPVETPLEDPVWQGQQVVGFHIDEKSQAYSLCFLNTQGHETRQIKLGGLSDNTLFGADSEGLLPVPFSHQWLVYKQYQHGGKDWMFFRLNTHNGTLRYLRQGEFLVWSPDGAYLCTTPGLRTTPYRKRRWKWPETPGEPADERTEDEYRMVWAEPLYVQAAKGGQMHQLTPRLSWVTGADWRRGGHNAAKRL